MGVPYEWLSDQKSHNDISDLSVFDVKFREDDLFSKNKYTGDYEKVTGRRGIYLDIPEENILLTVAMPVTLASPRTSNASSGTVVPIPTLDPRTTSTSSSTWTPSLK